MIKRSKPRQPPRDDSPNIFERFGNELAKGGGIDRLLLFGEPDSSGEFYINPQIERWLVAIDEAEQGDKSLLVKLMESGSIPNVIVPHIGDLIERCYHFKKPAHRPATASHRLTPKEIAMNEANCGVDDLLASGKSLDVAIKEVAAMYKKYGIKETVLREYHSKRRGPDRRIKARARAAKRD